MKVKYKIADFGSWFRPEPVIAFSQSDLSVNEARALAAGEVHLASAFQQLADMLREHQ